MFFLEPDQKNEQHTALVPIIDVRASGMVLIAGSCIVTVTLGIRQVFGLFMVPISNELGTGLRTFSLAIAAQNLLWGASSPFFGALADRIACMKRQRLAH